MNEKTSMWERVKNWYRALPSKKVYFELIAAVLSIPVLITVILVNLTNLNEKNKNDSITPTPTVAKKEVDKVTYMPVRISEKPDPSPNPSCKKEIGPVSITSPQEGEVVSNNPVCIDMSYTTGEFCAVVWSYKINDGPWSDYSANDFCLYNLDNGDKKLSVRVKSTTSSQEIVLQRNFHYAGGVVTPTAVATDSAH